jgi:glycosyltransferase involved in cell wall biosynthesis
VHRLGDALRAPVAYLTAGTVKAVFFMFRDSPQRRRALAAAPGSAERYALYGLDELRAKGFAVRHNLERAGPPPAWARAAGGAAKRALERTGGYGGDFASVLGTLQAANRSDVVFSTVDTVGIPLMLLKRAGRLRPPLVYAAIGLPERLRQLRTQRMRQLYASALGSCAAVVAYSEREAEDIEGWVRRNGERARVEFIPFGVDTGVFAPDGERATSDVVSVGADPHRDFELLVRVATRMPDVDFRIVTSREHVRGLESAPGNVSLEADLPFDEMRRRLAEARLVALPVRENSYSGATTVLLQAMALEKPVVVTRTSAIASGYGLVDGENCRLVAPGDEEGFERAVGDVLRDAWHARALAASARATVERELTWERYVDRLAALLDETAG